MARIARTRQDADGLFKSRWSLFHAAAPKPLCGVEVIVSNCPSDKRKKNEIGQKICC